MRSIFTFISFILLITEIHALQSDTTFYSAYDVRLKDREEKFAAYYELNDGENRNGKVNRYYLTHELYGFANYIKNDLNGAIKTLYKNGNLYEEGTLEKGNKIGIWHIGYKNGQSHAVVKYEINNGRNYMLVLTALDSLGQSMVENGNGYYKGKDIFGRNLIIEGQFKSGLPIGKWISRNTERIIYEESYSEKNELISGRSWDDKGNTYDYEEVEKQASFINGQDGWANFLRKNLQYPKKAVKKDIEGSVLMTFVINKNGTVENVEVLRGIGEGCDEEAIRVISKSRWNQATQRGQPVKSRMRLAIQFRLR